MICECGCGSETVNGHFLPGHDQKLRTQLEKRVGGLLSLRDFVESVHQYIDGEINLQQFGDKTKSILRK